LLERAKKQFQGESKEVAKTGEEGSDNESNKGSDLSVTSLKSGEEDNA